MWFLLAQDWLLWLPSPFSNLLGSVHLFRTGAPTSALMPKCDLVTSFMVKGSHDDYDLDVIYCSPGSPSWFDFFDHPQYVTIRMWPGHQLHGKRYTIAMMIMNFIQTCSIFFQLSAYVYIRRTEIFDHGNCHIWKDPIILVLVQKRDLVNSFINETAILIVELFTSLRNNFNPTFQLHFWLTMWKSFMKYHAHRDCTTFALLSISHCFLDSEMVSAGRLSPLS